MQTLIHLYIHCIIMDNDEYIGNTDYVNSRHDQLPWIEKYRPKKVNEIMLPDTLKLKILQIVKSNSIPNLIITGPPGIGKTTTIRCIANDIYGKYYNSSVLELNASDDRGIKSIQDIAIFCKFKKSYKKEDVDTYCKHKLVILDEADNMMDKAQHQLNTLMEKYKDTVRFVCTCNSSSDIIEAIQSRCLILRYMRVSNLQMIERLENICKLENVTYQKSALSQIADLSRGDMRNAINTLQLVFGKYGTVNNDHINDICDLPQPVSIRNIFAKCNKKSLREAVDLILKLKNEGYSGSDITLGMIYTVKSDLCNDIPELTKINMLQKICAAAYHISKSTDTNLQLISCICELSEIF